MTLEPHPAAADEMADLLRRHRREQGRAVGRRPRRAGELVAQLLARSGYARVRSSSALDDAWREAAGELLAKHSRLGNVRRGVLQITVANSTMAQEFTFQKKQLLGRLARLLPDEKIRDLRFSTGRIA